MTLAAATAIGPAGAQQQGWQTSVMAPTQTAARKQVGVGHKRATVPAAALPAKATASPGGEPALELTSSAPAAIAADPPSTLALATTSSSAADPTRRPAAPARSETARPDGLPSNARSIVEQYCTNILPAATERRLALQHKSIADAERELQVRIARLESKLAEVKGWVTRRDEFVARAEDKLVKIYSRMRPESAALQLAAMDEATAAAIMLNLDTRIAGLILNDMGPAQAARLSTIVANASALQERKRTSGDDTRQPSNAQPAHEGGVR